MTVDARHKAMLREMGVRLWWPSRTASAQPAVQAQPTAASHAPTSSQALRQAPGQPSGAAVGQDPAPPTRAAPPAAASASAAPAAPAAPTAAAGPGDALHWQVGPVQALHSSPDGPRWLLLSEQRQEGGSGSGGQASELLQRMLRAAGLHRGSQVGLAPMQRSAEGGVQGLEQALAAEPDLVFIMGRLAAQALLETAEPLGRLRGQVHELWGIPAIVSYDCVTLLRSPSDKAKAWDDLCLALQVAREQHAQRLASESD